MKQHGIVNTGDTMKIRQGFVSNSSSTSFCIIGVEDRTILEQLMKADELDIDEEGCVSFPYGAVEGEYLTYYSYDGSEPACAGLDAEPLLMKYSIPKAAEHLAKIIHNKLKIVVDPKKIKLLYGEASDGG